MPILEQRASTRPYLQEGRLWSIGDQRRPVLLKRC